MIDSHSIVPYCHTFPNSSSGLASLSFLPSGTPDPDDPRDHYDSRGASPITWSLHRAYADIIRKSYSIIFDSVFGPFASSPVIADPVLFRPCNDIPITQNFYCRVSCLIEQLDRHGVIDR